jgi:hypothetical protein
MDNKGELQTAPIDISTTKDFLVLVPLLGSALAITYDVAYFSAININLFSLFSLSEHIVFALEVFPAALLFAFAVGVLFYFSPRIRSGVRSAMRDATGGATRPDGYAHRSYKSLFLVVALLLILVSVCILASVTFLPKAVALEAVICSTIMVIAFETRSVMGRLAFFFLAATAFAFSFGYQIASETLHPSSSVKHLVTTIETKNDGTIDARLIRSGDRGVLFLNKQNNQVALLPWDEIKQISTEAP